MGDSSLRDYVAWHGAYHDPESELSKRLRRVQREVTSVLDRAAGRPIRLLSVAAGDGRDVLEVLRQRSKLDDVSGTFLELHPGLVATANKSIREVGQQDRIHAVTIDASWTSVYAPHVPADLVLLVGIFGNISNDDVRDLIFTARSFCAPNATLIWTRDIREPDMGPDLARWFEEAQFVQVALHEHVEGSRTRVGVHQYSGETQPLGHDRRIFTFLR